MVVIHESYLRCTRFVCVKMIVLGEDRCVMWKIWTQNILNTEFNMLKGCDRKSFNWYKLSLAALCSFPAHFHLLSSILYIQLPLIKGILIFIHTKHRKLCSVYVWMTATFQSSTAHLPPIQQWFSGISMTRGRLFIRNNRSVLLMYPICRGLLFRTTTEPKPK